jgi:hypothetical protein
MKGYYMASWNGNCYCEYNQYGARSCSSSTGASGFKTYSAIARNGGPAPFVPIKAGLIVGLVIGLLALALLTAFLIRKFVCSKKNLSPTKETENKSEEKSQEMSSFT